MLLIPLLFREYLWVIPIVLQMVGYFFLFRKMRMPSRLPNLPFVAEYKLTTLLFKYRRTFWRPFVIASVFVCSGIYLNPFNGSGATTAKIFFLIAILFYGFFLLRLYRRLTKTFTDKISHQIPLTFILWLLPPLGLLILALGKLPYNGPLEFRQARHHGKVFHFLSRIGLVLVSGVEIIALVLAVGLFTVMTYPPRILAQTILDETLADTKDVTGTGVVVTREDAMGEASANLATMDAGRDRFFPGHEQDESVVVMEYIVGADLEDTRGLASANIAQMIEATKQGSGLTFVLECGGSKRWFTKGIDDESYGRYTVHDGKLEKVIDLDDSTCMSEPESLADFISWARDAYPADRTMLVLWDHGGGLSLGYGVDAYNKRKGDQETLSVSEIASAIEQSGMRFDVIGFDACLMQDIDVAVALEPYADFYLASEETEGGYGWCYTSAFGKLAADPSMSSEDFGREMVACYDPYNTAVNRGEEDTTATLSFV